MTFTKRDATFLGAATATVLGLAIGLNTFSAHGADGATVIELTQTGCQFIESENGVDHGFTTSSKADCDAINDETGDERLSESKTIIVTPGKYIFRVTNRDVPYELGFWLRGDGLLSRATLPSVSGGGLIEGATQDYVVVLEPGEYVYSCPLNPTPDYRLVVEG